MSSQSILQILRQHESGRISESVPRDPPVATAFQRHVPEAVTARPSAKAVKHSTPKFGDARNRDIIDPSAPYKVAHRLVDQHFTQAGIATLHYHGGSFYSYSGSAYPEASTNGLRARTYEYLDSCLKRDPDDPKNLIPVKPNIALVGNVTDALKAATYLDDAITAPAWLGSSSNPPADEILSCVNGLVHLPTRNLHPHTPRFFTHNALPFNFERDAPQPAGWLQFLSQLWPNDPVSIETLQEIFGLALTGDTSHQKLFLLIGPPRSGKGTIARVITALVGPDNTNGPTLAGLGTNFGLAPLIGKRLAIISDARLGGRADQHAITERLLSISGEDSITIDRKYLAAWTGRLQVRFLIISNELPRLADASGALANRFIVLTLTNSFLGNEDRGLTNRLLGELPGILNWSIDGLLRLMERGHFRQPESSREAIVDLADLASPIGAFVRDCCVVGAGCTADPDALFKAWCDWCESQGRKEHGTKQSFGRDLRAALPLLKMIRPRTEDGSRERLYDGIGIQGDPGAAGDTDDRPESDLG